MWVIRETGERKVRIERGKRKHVGDGGHRELLGGGNKGKSS